MAAAKEGYRKKQAMLMILVFVCIGVAIWGVSPAVNVGAILVACAICFWAATMEPEKSHEEHHH
jgi:hypothetical protein